MKKTKSSMRSRSLVKTMANERHFGRLEGQEEGVVWGKVEERSMIVKWLKNMGPIAAGLSKCIESGAHVRWSRETMPSRAA